MNEGIRMPPKRRASGFSVFGCSPIFHQGKGDISARGQYGTGTPAGNLIEESIRFDHSVIPHQLQEMNIGHM